MPEVLNHYQLGKGPVDLLLLHGLAADSGFWLPLVSQIEMSKYTIHLLDLKGHGKSTFHDKITGLPGEVVLSDEKDNLTFNASNALDCGFSKGTADSLEQLAPLLGLR